MKPLTTNGYTMISVSPEAARPLPRKMKRPAETPAGTNKASVVRVSAASVPPSRLPCGGAMPSAAGPSAAAPPSWLPNGSPLRRCGILDPKHAASATGWRGRSSSTNGRRYPPVTLRWHWRHSTHARMQSTARSSYGALHKHQGRSAPRCGRRPAHSESASSYSKSGPSRFVPLFLLTARFAWAPDGTIPPGRQKRESSPFVPGLSTIFGTF